MLRADQRKVLAEVVFAVAHTERRILLLCEAVDRDSVRQVGVFEAQRDQYPVINEVKLISVFDKSLLEDSLEETVVWDIIVA